MTSPGLDGPGTVGAGGVLVDRMRWALVEQRAGSCAVRRCVGVNYPRLGARARLDIVTAKRSPLPPGEEQRRARVLPHVDRARRVAAMLDRGEAEAAGGEGDEPAWDVGEIARIAVRTP